ncbi:MAG: SCP2 sterol-binding domain-containing protein [Ktedonobacteraceae bacterium]|nr:SCP2 sterol-binding domain-containing protein [Ktedonobacteraceae bacterium]
MSEHIQTFFTGLAARRYEPLLHSVSGTVQWNIEGEGPWNVMINRGTITVCRDPCTPASLLSCNTDTFLALAKGVQNPFTAFLQGKLAIEGNIGLALVFQRAFDNQSGDVTDATNSRRER